MTARLHPRQLSLLLLLAALGACSKTPESAPPAATPPAPTTAPAAPAATTETPAAPAATVAQQKAPEGASVSFANLKDGDSVSSPFKVTFAVSGMSVAPAGTTEPGSGHFHLLIDTDLPPQNLPLPSDEHVLHFGKAQTDTDVTLPPGPHTLQIEFADGAHVPFDPPVVSERINITVK